MEVNRILALPLLFSPVLLPTPPSALVCLLGVLCGFFCCFFCFWNVKIKEKKVRREVQERTARGSVHSPLVQPCTDSEGVRFVCLFVCFSPREEKRCVFWVLYGYVLCVWGYFCLFVCLRFCSYFFFIFCVGFGSVEKKKTEVAMCAAPLPTAWPAQPAPQRTWRSCPPVHPRAP